MKIKNLIAPIIGVSTLLGSTNLITSCGSEGDTPIPSQKSNFNTTSWLEISSLCNDFEVGMISKEEFCSHFVVDDLLTPEVDEKEVTCLDDFVGQVRTVSINYHDYRVKVLGCQQDYMAQEPYKPVTFTFQFQDAICAATVEEQLLRTKWNSQDNNKNYSESTVHKNLDSTEDAEWTLGESDKYSIYRKIDSLDGINEIEMKLISHKVNIYHDNDSKWTPDQQPVYVFQPTLHNIFSENAINSWVNFFDEEKACYKAEGQGQYSYYAKEIGDGSISDGHECLKCYDSDQEPVIHWIDSPVLALGGGQQTDFNNSWAITSEGKIFETNIDSEEVAVTPCFCI